MSVLSDYSRKGLSVYEMSAASEEFYQSEFANSQDYIKYIYGGLEGYIFKCRKKYVDGEMAFLSSFHRNSGLVNQYYENQQDTYVSMNSFYCSKESKEPERKVSCLKRLNALYVDIDCYKENMTNDVVLKDLEDRVFGNELPYPTLVVDSGRGLYLIWKFKKSEDRNALPRWSRVQDHLVNSLKEYGADSACRDAARVLRVPGTINSRSGSKVKVLRYYEKEYTLYGIINELKIDYSFEKSEHKQRKASEKQIKYATVLASKLGIELPDFDSRSETYKFIEQHQDAAPYIKNSGNIIYFKSGLPRTIIQGYLEDLRILFSLRQKADCKREIALFLCRYWNYELYRNDEIALAETLSLNSSFAYPFSEKYVIQNTISAVKRIDDGERYNYKKSTLVDLLEITNEEMESLHYLVVLSEDEKKRLKQAKNHAYYVKRLSDRDGRTKAELIEERCYSLRMLLKKGCSISEITDKLGISRATYYRMLSKIDKDESFESKKNKVSGAEIIEFGDVKEVIEELVNKISDKSKNTLRYVVSFFKLLFWERALAPYAFREREVDIYYLRLFEYLCILYKGYERSDDSKGHDTA